MRTALAALAACALLAATANARPTEACSARGLDVGKAPPASVLPITPGLTRQVILAHAAACDYAGLERIGRQEGGFRFSFGPGRSAPAYWRAEEARGTHPMASLVQALRGPFLRSRSGVYFWPKTPKGYAYTGWRLAITDEGDWQYFVRGR